MISKPPFVSGIIIGHQTNGFFIMPYGVMLFVISLNSCNKTDYISNKKEPTIVILFTVIGSASLRLAL